MSCEIYFGSGSPYSWSVLLTIAVKGVACDLHRIRVGEQQNKSEEFLALNPRGKVPVLKDGDTVIYESIAIMAYLDRQHPAPPLFGRTPAECGVIWQSLSELQNYVSPPALRVVLPIFSGKTGARAGRIAHALPKLHDELAGLERRLADSEYLAGHCLSAADLVFFPMLQGLLRAAGKPEARELDLRVLPLGERYPRIAEWIPRIEALPGYDQTYPPHWRNP